MDRITITMAIWLTLVFGTGVMAGVIAMIAAASQRQDKRRLTQQAAPDARRPGGTRQRDVTAQEAGQVRR